MRKIEHVGYNEFMEAVNSLHNVECLGCIDGCLLDDLLYIGDNEKGCELVLLASVKYLNEWSSCYTVRIAVTENDKQKLYNRFNDMEATAADYY